MPPVIKTQNFKARHAGKFVTPAQIRHPRAGGDVRSAPSVLPRPDGTFKEELHQFA
ncbi:hypothetical protein COXBURSA331_A0842 [Coxiella burnetii RSA 331]|nr:hypothetical protein COXBURSA331_A0842 [Coxiella burnetii RSA 331]EDR36429.1 hypothetical protein COXBURSA334_0709 [Coxiella burnetii Q321]